MKDAQPNRSRSAAGVLSDTDLDLYAWVLRRRSLSAAAAAAELGLPENEAAAGLVRLMAAQLVFPSPDDPEGGFAVAPDAAFAHLSVPIEAHIRQAQQQLVLLRAELARFTERYHQNRTQNSAALEVIDNVQEVRAAIARAAERCRSEVITCQPGGGARVPEAMQEAANRDRRLLERGVSIRTLYHHTARFNAPSQAYVAMASALGGQYRTVHTLFGRLVAFDREIAFLPVEDSPDGAVVVREQNAVAYLWDIFEQTWESAKPFVDAQSQGLEEVARETHETIVRLLAAGLKDETIARRLGMSLRTARRHIADIMEELNATSRFQAGVAAARWRLLQEPEEPEEPEEPTDALRPSG